VISRVLRLVTVFRGSSPFLGARHRFRAKW
jgi:hypothetical protein